MESSAAEVSRSKYLQYAHRGHCSCDTMCGNHTSTSVILESVSAA